PAVRTRSLPQPRGGRVARAERDAVLSANRIAVQESTLTEAARFRPGPPLSRASALRRWALRACGAWPCLCCSPVLAGYRRAAAARAPPRPPADWVAARDEGGSVRRELRGTRAQAAARPRAAALRRVAPARSNPWHRGARIR